MSGKWMDMPDDKLMAKVTQNNGRSATYTLMRVRTSGKDTEVWGWSPLCYSKVKDQFMRMMEP